jgi:hypothetical protein
LKINNILKIKLISNFKKLSSLDKRSVVYTVNSKWYHTDKFLCDFHDKELYMRFLPPAQTQRVKMHPEEKENGGKCLTNRIAQLKWKGINFP